MTMVIACVLNCFFVSVLDKSNVRKRMKVLVWITVWVHSGYESLQGMRVLVTLRSRWQDMRVLVTLRTDMVQTWESWSHKVMVTATCSRWSQCVHTREAQNHGLWCSTLFFFIQSKTLTHRMVSPVLQWVFPCRLIHLRSSLTNTSRCLLPTLLDLIPLTVWLISVGCDNNFTMSLYQNVVSYTLHIYNFYFSAKFQ